jgi:hypothetical protein
MSSSSSESYTHYVPNHSASRKLALNHCHTDDDVTHNQAGDVHTRNEPNSPTGSNSHEKSKRVSSPVQESHKSTRMSQDSDVRGCHYAQTGMVHSSGTDNDRQLHSRHFVIHISPPAGRGSHAHDKNNHNHGSSVEKQHRANQQNSSPVQACLFTIEPNLRENRDDVVRDMLRAPDAELKGWLQGRGLKTCFMLPC